MNVDGQLSFDEAHLRLVASDLPRALPPVMQWRKLISRVGPPADAKCSVRCFRAVGRVLADYANRNGGSVFPSVETIAADAGYSERSVQHALNALEWKGLITRDKRGGRSRHGGGRTSRIELVVPFAVGRAVENDEERKGAVA